MASQQQKKGEEPATGKADGIGPTETVKTIAERHQVSKAFVYALMSRGEIAFVQFGRHKRVVAASFADWLKLNLRPAATTSPAS